MDADQAGERWSQLIAFLDSNPERYVIKEELDLHLLKQLIEKHDLYFALETIKELPFMKKSVERYAGIGQNTIKKMGSDLSLKD